VDFRQTFPKPEPIAKMASTATPPWNGEAPPNRLDILQWHKFISPLKVDIVGDFAGKELFAIVGEAMLAHCVREAEVDFNDSMTCPPPHLAELQLTDL